MPTTTELTEEYIRRHPSIQDCLAKGLVNYSSLARLISGSISSRKKTTKEAILIAARRYRDKIAQSPKNEQKIIRLLGESELEIKNRIFVMVVDRRFSDRLLKLEKEVKETGGIFYMIDGVSVVTIVSSEKYYAKASRLFAPVKTERDLVMIILKTSEDIETIPGVMGYLYSLFMGYGINIVETLSCWTDTIFVVSEKDLAAALNLLKF
ncbi:MAG: hypothetical protein ABH879_04440 [archaeon]